MDPKEKLNNLPPTLHHHLTNYNTLWLKVSTPEHITFVGKDMLCVASGCQIILHNLITRSEQIINANSELYGDGVSCVGGHKTHPLLAYAERREPPRVFLVRTTSDLKYAHGLKCNFMELSAITFSDSELLFGLSGYPECSLVVWKWRTAEMMREIETGMFFNKNVILKSGYSTQPIYLSQLITYTSELKMWEVACCGRKCILKGVDVSFIAEDPRLMIHQLVWSNEGNCFACDTTGNVFKYDFENHVMKILIPSLPGPGPACFSWWNNGLLVSGADNILRHYSKETYEIKFTADKIPPLTRIFATSTREHLVLLTSTSDLLIHEANTHTYPYFRSDEAGITHFGLIPPKNDLIITLNKYLTLSLWDTPTGTLQHSLTLETPALHLACNATYPYVALSFPTGHLKLFSVLRNIIQPLCQFYLTTSPLQEVKFFESDRIIAAACKDNGQIFVVEGIPGKKFKVLTGIVHEEQIVDYIVVGGRNCLKVFLIPVTSEKDLAGNRFVRYCVVRHKETTMKTYEVLSAGGEKLYTALYVGRGQANRDRVFYATPLDCKNVHEVEVKHGDIHARIINRFQSQHMLRHFRYQLNPYFTLSSGYDGIVILRNLNFEMTKVLIPHHRFDGGIISSCFDPHNRRLITLGRDGILICNELPGTPLSKKTQALLYAKSEELTDLFKTPTLGFNPHGVYEGVCWLEYRKLLKIDEERIKYQAQRKQIVDTFNSIQKQAVILLNHNLEGPKNERLELQDFNLNLQRKDDLTRAATYACEKLKIYLEKYIQDQDRISAQIKELFWDPIDEPTKNLWSIFGNFDVQSYAVLPPDMEEAELLERIVGYREIEDICAREDSFKPWTCLTEKQKETIPTAYPKLGDDKPIVDVSLTFDDDDEDNEHYAQEKEDEYETYVAFFGSSVPLYIKLVNSEYEQAEVQSFLQQDWTYSISKDQQNQLRTYFNKEFENCFQQKLKEMGLIIERNARLRYIISEMNYFSEEQYNVNPLDPEWKQDETPELITKVENDEVGVLPYISPSEQAFLDAKAAEEERIRLLLLADDFKERALMKMMNGVLEIRWEDELRREIPKPKCMIEKLPENFNEEDLRLIKDYEDKVQFLNSERKRYRKILQAEYIKVGNQLREGVKKFNDKMKELLVKKIQIEAALRNELLRMHRLRARGLRRVESNLAEKSAQQEIIKNDKKTDEMSQLINSLHYFDEDIKAALELLLLKERVVEKQFKREFQDYSPAQVEIITKLYKKRPRINFKLITSACSLQEMAKVVATNCQPMLIFGEPLEFLKTLDLMDKYVGISPIVDEDLFNNMVRVRRLKIEIELKIRACQMELSEAESTQQMYIIHHSKYKELGTQLLSKLDDVRHQKVKDMLNMELQLVMKQAFVELPRTGSMHDFDDAILVNRKDVEDINAIIQDTGAKKIRAMRSALQFRKEIAMKEWQHKKKKMEIADLQHELAEIGTIKLTKEIQEFLKMRTKGEAEKNIVFENELDAIKVQYSRQIEQRRQEVWDLNEKVDVLKAENKRLNREIQDLNIDVCEATIKVDDALSEKEKKFVNMRIQANLKRSRLVNQIQVNHNQIMVLQAELELGRLRTVPILDYKVQE